jgi:positive regulator of sigma E activity
MGNLFYIKNTSFINKIINHPDNHEEIKVNICHKFNLYQRINVTQGELFSNFFLASLIYIFPGLIICFIGIIGINTKSNVFAFEFLFLLFGVIGIITGVFMFYKSVNKKTPDKTEIEKYYNNLRFNGEIVEGYVKEVKIVYDKIILKYSVENNPFKINDYTLSPIRLEVNIYWSSSSNKIAHLSPGERIIVLYLNDDLQVIL